MTKQELKIAIVIVAFVVGFFLGRKTIDVEEKIEYLKGETINDLDSQVLVWKIYETVNGKYNGTYYVEWNAFIGGSKNIVGKYTNTKGKTFKVNLKCTSTSSAR